MQFTATDCDSGSNSLLEYSVSGGNRHFTINSTTGHLTTNAVLDREDISFYNLVITAADHGMPSLNSSIQVTYLRWLLTGVVTVCTGGGGVRRC